MKRTDKIAIILELIKDEGSSIFTQSVGIAMQVLSDDQLEGVFLSNIQKNIRKLDMMDERSRLALMCLVTFELDMDKVSIPLNEIYKIDELMAHYEKQEKYELCAKLKQYKTKVEGNV